MTDLPAEGREYWTPTLSELPDGFVAVKVRFDQGTTAGEWHDFQDIDDVRKVLLAGPDVDTDTYPNPAETIALTVGRHQPVVMLVGPGSKEIILRATDPIDVR